MSQTTEHVQTGTRREEAWFAVWSDGSSGSAFWEREEAERYAAKASTWGNGPVVVSHRERLVTPWMPVDQNEEPER